MIPTINPQEIPALDIKNIIERMFSEYPHVIDSYSQYVSLLEKSWHYEGVNQLKTGLIELNTTLIASPPKDAEVETMLITEILEPCQSFLSSLESVTKKNGNTFIENNIRQIEQKQANDSLINSF